MPIFKWPFSPKSGKAEKVNGSGTGLTRRKLLTNMGLAGAALVSGAASFAVVSPHIHIQLWNNVDLQGEGESSIIKFKDNAGVSVRLDAALKTVVDSPSDVEFAGPEFRPIGRVRPLSAIADKNGMSLEQLEIEFNVLKQLLRDYGVIAR